MRKSKLLILAVLSFYVLMGSVLAQTFPNRHVSSLLKVGTWFIYHLSAPTYPQIELDVNVTIIGINGQTISFLSSTYGQTSSGTANVGNVVGSVEMSNTFPFIGTNLNVGDQVSAEGSINAEESLTILGRTRDVVSIQTLISGISYSIKWDKEGGYPVFISGQTASATATITLTDSNVFSGGDSTNWLSQFLSAVGEWVNSVLDVNSVLGIDPSLLGFISLGSAGIAVILVIAFLKWLVK
jgi:hypothetical protein